MDLELISTDDLVEELERRSEAGVTILVQNISDCKERYIPRWWGGEATVRGLLKVADEVIGLSTRHSGPVEVESDLED